MSDMSQQAGIQLYNARGSCTLDMSCSVARVVGISELGGENGMKRTRIAIPNPGMNNIWARLIFRGSGYGSYNSGTSEDITKVETWEDRQGITVTLPFKPNAKPDPEFPYTSYNKDDALFNPRAVMYGFY